MPAQPDGSRPPQADPADHGDPPLLPVGGGPRGVARQQHGGDWADPAGNRGESGGVVGAVRIDVTGQPAVGGGVGADVDDHGAGLLEANKISKIAQRKAILDLLDKAIAALGDLDAGGKSAKSYAWSTLIGIAAGTLIATTGGMAAWIGAMIIA